MSFRISRYTTCLSILTTPGLCILGTAAGELLSSKSAHAQIISLPGTTSGQVIPAKKSKKTQTKVYQKKGSDNSENIMVVGTHLGARETEQIQPVALITSDQIQQSSAMTMGEVFSRIPSMNFSGNSYSNFGGSCINIRNLGTARTLVLVDGHRMVEGPGGCVDMNAIAPAMVDRVEILKDGSSTTYGSDAIAGVINITLKKDYTGTTLTANGGISDSGDAETSALTATHGWDIMHGRGNFILSGSYNYQAPVDANARKWAMHDRAGWDNSPGAPQYYGSTYTPNGYFVAANGGAPLTSQPGQLGNYSVTPNGNGGFSPFGYADDYDYSQGNQMLAQQSIQTVAGSGHFDITKNVQFYIDGNWTHTAGWSKGVPMFIGTPATTLTGNSGEMIIPSGNPYNPFGEDVAMYKRMMGLGERYSDLQNDQYQATVGLRGSIPHSGGWTYDAFYSFGKSVGEESQNGQINWVKMENALGFHQTGGGGSTTGYYDPSVCTSQPGCVLINPFSQTLSPAAKKYIGVTDDYPSGYELRDVQVTFANKHIARLPYGPLGIAVGVEHRGLDGYSYASNFASSGQASNYYYTSTSGGYNVTEVFGELSIPLLKNLPAAKSLSAQVSGRFSNYNTFGQTYNWHAGLIYAPTDSIRFRANLATGFRAPQIGDLYAGQTISLSGAHDPCGQISEYGALAGIVAANCRAQGLNPSTFKQVNNAMKYISGGNPSLQPEESRTYTIGTILSPTFLPGFSATIDYFHTSITHALSTPSLQTELDGCYESVNMSSAYCNVIHGRDVSGQLNPVSNYEENVGAFKEDGLDISAQYNYDIDYANSLHFGADIQDVMAYKEQNTPSTPFVSYLGSVGTPKWLANGTATFTHGRWSFTYMLRFIDGMYYFPSSDYNASFTQWYKINQTFYHDVSITYRGNKFTVTGGVRNIGGKQPQFDALGDYNTDPGMYDWQGRYMYLKAQVNF
ncbi:TonB-dependent receptor [Komagataeibacter sp. FXV2]|nr:TonB-dependent receptor [Komagataeibacter sp. FXV2]